MKTASKNKEQTLRKIVESKFFHRVCSCETFHEELLLRLMSILSKSLLTLVRGHLMTLFLFTVWHCFKILNLLLMLIISSSL